MHLTLLLCILLITIPTLAIIDACNGYQHFCVINEMLKMRCGGDNSYGQLGYGDYVSRGSHPYDLPLQIVPQVNENDPYVDVECGANHTCARTVSGVVSCWGDNSKGQLGAGTTLPNIPIAGTVVILQGPSMSLCAGSDFACSVSSTTPYPVQCWGDNSKGQLCTGDSRNRGTKQSDFPLPTVITGIARVFCGYDHVLALLTSNTVRAWGDNRYGQLGFGRVDPPYNLVGIVPNTQPIVPVIQQGLPTTIIDIKGGIRHTCFLYQSGNMTCVGYNSRGQLGYPSIPSVGSNYQYLPPPQVNVGFTIRTLSAGYEFTCVTGYSNTVVVGMLPNITACWGDNMYGQLGTGTTTFGIGLLDGTMPPPMHNATLSNSIGFVIGSTSQKTNYLPLTSSTMRGGNATVAPHLVYRQVLIGWGDATSGQLLTGFSMSNTLIPVALNTECGDLIVDMLGGEECDVGPFANGQQCTPFCNVAPCMDNSTSCTPCYIPNFSVRAEQAGCFLTTKQCPNSAPTPTSVCSNGIWNTQAIINNSTLTLTNPLSIIGSYTQHHSATLILLGNGTITVNGTAYLDGVLTIDSYINTTNTNTTNATERQETSNITAVQASSISGTFSSVQTHTDDCTQQATERNGGIETLVVISSPCPPSTTGRTLAGVAGAFVVIAALVGIILFVSYKRNICRPIFHEREGYDSIQTS